MGYSATTEALLQAIHNDVRGRVDAIVDGAEREALTLHSEMDVERLLQSALVEVEEALAEAAQAMAREIRRERAC